MTSLRMRVVEALKPYIEVDLAIEPNEWSLAQRYNAGLALDAMLDCLTENADEWFDAWTEWQDEDGDPKFVGLVAVLREDR